MGHRIRNVFPAHGGGQLSAGRSHGNGSQEFGELDAKAGHADPREVNDQEPLVPESVQRNFPKKWPLEFGTRRLRLHAQ